MTNDSTKAPVRPAWVTPLAFGNGVKTDMRAMGRDLLVGRKFQPAQVPRLLSCCKLGLRCQTWRCLLFWA
jgi:hypothetical protein